MGIVFKEQVAPTGMLQAGEIVYQSIEFIVWVNIMRITFGRFEQIRKEKRPFSSANLQMQFVRMVLNCRILWQLLICTMK